MTTLYSTIPVDVSLISSQNGATTTGDDSGNDLGLGSLKDVPKLIRPFELICIIK